MAMIHFLFELQVTKLFAANLIGRGAQAAQAIANSGLHLYLVNFTRRPLSPRQSSTSSFYCLLMPRGAEGPFFLGAARLIREDFAPSCKQPAA